MIETYFNAERTHGLMFVAVGLVTAGFAVWAWRHVPFWLGAAWPLLAVALIQLLVGASLWWHSPKESVRVQHIAAQERARIASEEISRMQGVMKGFRMLRQIEFGLLAAGFLLLSDVGQWTPGPAFGTHNNCDFVTSTTITARLHPRSATVREPFDPLSLWRQLTSWSPRRHKGRACQKMTAFDARSIMCSIKIHMNWRFFMVFVEQLKSELSDLLRTLPKAIHLIYGADTAVSGMVGEINETETLLWQEVMKLHDYALLGEVFETEDSYLWMLAEFLVGLPAFGSVLEYVGCNVPHTVIEVVRIGSARKVLDGETRLIPADAGVGPDVLTLNEIAFLANMDVRSVRNIVKIQSGSQIDGETLVAVHEGKRTVVPVAYARKWLGRRKDFRVTRASGTPTAQAPIQLGAATLAALAAAARRAHLSPDDWINRQIGKAVQR